RIVSFWTRLFPQCDANCPAVVRGQRASVFYDEQGGDCELSGAPSLRDSTSQVSTRPSGGSPCVPKIIPQAGHWNGSDRQLVADRLHSWVDNGGKPTAIRKSTANNCSADKHRATNNRPTNHGIVTESADAVPRRGDCACQ